LRGNADDVFIIQIASNLVQAGAKGDFGGRRTGEEHLLYRGTAGGVTGSHMEGVISVKTAVTFITGSSINGRVLTQAGCVLQKGLRSIRGSARMRCAGN
jgi:hypothetical protein